MNLLSMVVLKEVIGKLLSIIQRRVNWRIIPWVIFILISLPVYAIEVLCKYGERITTWYKRNIVNKMYYWAIWNIETKGRNAKNEGTDYEN